MIFQLFAASLFAARSRHHGYHCNRATWLLAIAGGLALSLVPLTAEDLVRSNFESSTEVYNPWAGVTDAGLIKVLPGRQPAVNNQGQTYEPEFGPSVAVGDLTGDGLPDMVIADSHGFFWFFANSGTPGQPKFTHGEIMPIWLGFSWGDPNYLGEDGADNIIPKIQFIDLGGDGKLLSLVVGNYVGRMFIVPNRGTTASPAFPMPKDRSLLIVPTRKPDPRNTNNPEMLWTNFLSPYMVDWWHTGNLDLIVGDGAYAANSIFLLTNKGSRDRPTFLQEFTKKIIPGMGREHLTPQVVDWNGDGKPDIITGERLGYISVFLNKTPDTAKTADDIVFDEGQHVRIGTKDDFGDFSAPYVNDLPGNKLPNLIITNGKGEILYAQNTGTPGKPQFGDPVPMKGINPFPKINKPFGWSLRTPHGVPHELLVCTNKKVQPEFTPPPDTKFNNALRFYVYPIKNAVFNDFYYPADDNNEPHAIIYNTNFQIREETDYKISFWVRTTGNIRDLRYHIRGWAHLPDDEEEEVNLGSAVRSSNGWTLYEDTFRFRLKNTKTKGNLVTVGLEFPFYKQGEIYLDDVWIRADGGQ